MDKKYNRESYPIIRDGLYRAPMKLERDLGLWVDRIGIACDHEPIRRLRVLGMYAALSVTEGQGIYYSVLTDEIPVSEGDAMLVFPEVPSLYHPLDRWRTTWIVWSGGEAERLEAMRFLQPDNPVLPGKGAVVEEAYQKLVPLMTEEQAGDILCRKAVLLDTVGRLSSHDAGNDPDLFGHNRLIQEAISIIRERLEDPPTVKELAKNAGIPSCHFRRLFLETTGRNPKDFILSMRIMRAKALLLDGMSIKETAGMLGFDDVFYFMRLFRRIVGTTARGYAAPRSSPGPNTFGNTSPNASALFRSGSGLRGRGRP